MSSGNNREGTGVWFISAEWTFGIGWKSYSERNNAKWPWVSCESSSSTKLRHRACGEHCSGRVSPRPWSFGSLVSAWGYCCTRSLRHWDPCLRLPPNGCLALKYPLGSWPKSILKTSAGLPTSLQYLQKIYLRCVKLILRCFSRICLKKIQQTMLKKRAAAVIWVHAESGNLYHVLLRSMEHCQPYDKVAVACLLVFVDGSSITHRVEN